MIPVVYLDRVFLFLIRYGRGLLFIFTPYQLSGGFSSSESEGPPRKKSGASSIVARVVQPGEQAMP